MNNIPYELIARYLAGECDDNEKREILKWIENNPEEMEKFTSIWEQIPANNFEPDVEKALRNVDSRIEAASKKRSKRIFIWVCSTAATIALLITGLWWSQKVELTKYTHGAQLLTLQTSKGESAEVLLPDGSKIWLNHTSKLKYPEVFSENKREVYLEGEAFFDISPDADKPFVIYANETRTQVVGTSFGIRAFKEADEVVVTVATGIINFSAEGKMSKQIELKKGEQGICKLEGKKIEKKDISDINYLAWKTKVLIFENTPLHEVANIVGDVYNTPIVVDGSIVNSQITSTFNKLSLDEIVHILEITLEIKAERTDNGISLSKH